MAVLEDQLEQILGAMTGDARGGNVSATPPTAVRAPRRKPPPSPCVSQLVLDHEHTGARSSLSAQEGATCGSHHAAVQFLPAPQLDAGRLPRRSLVCLVFLLILAAVIGTGLLGPGVQLVVFTKIRDKILRLAVISGRSTLLVQQNSTQATVGQTTPATAAALSALIRRAPADPFLGPHGKFAKEEAETMAPLEAIIPGSSDSCRSSEEPTVDDTPASPTNAQMPHEKGARDSDKTAIDYAALTLGKFYLDTHTGLVSSLQELQTQAMQQLQQYQETRLYYTGAALLACACALLLCKLARINFDAGRCRGAQPARDEAWRRSPFVCPGTEEHDLNVARKHATHSDWQRRRMRAGRDALGSLQGPTGGDQDCAAGPAGISSLKLSKLSTPIREDGRGGGGGATCKSPVRTPREMADLASGHCRFSDTPLPLSAPNPLWKIERNLSTKLQKYHARILCRCRRRLARDPGLRKREGRRKAGGRGGPTGRVKGVRKGGRKEGRGEGRKGGREGGRDEGG